MRRSIVIVSLALVVLVGLFFVFRPDDPAGGPQYPVLALMTFYTIFSLWILSQPIVE